VNYRKEDLQPFCSTYREPITQPLNVWNYRGETNRPEDNYDCIATNGVVMLALPKTYLRWCPKWDSFKGPRLCEVYPYFQGLLGAKESYFVSLPEVPPLKYEYIGGPHISYADYMETLALYEAGSEGFEPEPTEYNLAPEPVAEHVHFLGRWINSYYVHKLTRCLTGVQFLDDFGTADAGTPYRFRFTGGYGLLMPMRCPNDR
jgi:hypothetical protein